MSRPSPQVRSTFISSIFTWSVDLCCQSCWVQQDSNCLLTRIRNARKSWSQMLPASNPGFCKEPSIGQTRPSWRNIWRKHSLQVQTIQHWQSLSCVSTAYLQHTVWWVTSWFWMFWLSRSQSNSDSVWLGGRWQHQFPETHVPHEIIYGQVTRVQNNHCLLWHSHLQSGARALVPPLYTWDHGCLTWLPFSEFLVPHDRSFINLLYADLIYKYHSLISHSQSHTPCCA